MAGIQFYLEMVDDDVSQPHDELIDIIMVNLEPLPVTASPLSMNVTGVYRLGWMDLTFNAHCHCTQNFSGEFCTQNRTQNNTAATEGEKGVDVARVVAPTVVLTASALIVVGIAVIAIVLRTTRLKKHQHSVSLLDYPVVRMCVCM